jgi:hypothetical protein
MRKKRTAISERHVSCIIAAPALRAGRLSNRKLASETIVKKTNSNDREFKDKNSAYPQ